MYLMDIHNGRFLFHFMEIPIIRKTLNMKNRVHILQLYLVFVFHYT